MRSQKIIAPFFSHNLPRDFPDTTWEIAETRLTCTSDRLKTSCKNSRNADTRKVLTDLFIDMDKVAQLIKEAKYQLNSSQVDHAIRSLESIEARLKDVKLEHDAAIKSDFSITLSRLKSSMQPSTAVTPTLNGRL